ncbi:MAG TPA: hypothetical protein VFS08_03165 [Gemmatimonadaceae bacterium]|nr:hypothetical protein [Gemmatimonadaceae bacterium]
MTTQWKPALPGQLAEQRARKAIADSPSQNLQLLFAGAELVLNYDRRKEYRAQATQDLREVATIGAGVAREKLGGMVANPKQMLLDYLRDALPGVEELEQIVEELVPDFLADMAGAAPYFGPCLQVVRGGTNLVMAARGTIHRYDITKAKPIITPGAPLRAVEAMQEAVEREIARELLVGSRQIAAGSASIAVTAASWGADYASPIIGAANALLNFTHNVYLHHRDNKEMRRANVLLKAPGGVTLDVFDTSPILGCFLVGQVPTSDLLNLIGTRIGSGPNWMSDVEKLVKKHIHPLQYRAAKLIQSSRFYLKSPNEALFEAMQNKAALLPVDGNGPKAYYNLAMNKKYNFGRQVSEAKHSVRKQVRGFGERMLQKMGVMKAPVQLP